MATRRSTTGHAATAFNLPAIAALIDEGGEITVGAIAQIPCVATATDPDQCLAMLVQRDDESLVQLLLRLDSAVAAFHTDGPIDEVNPAPPAVEHKRSSSSRR